MWSTVKWDNPFSSFFKLVSGVRQGGILSPSLIALIVDDILLKLSESKRGCYLGWICFNSVMYADDLMLIDISIRDLQLLVDICVKEFKLIGLEINLKKLHV